MLSSLDIVYISIYTHAHVFAVEQKFQLSWWGNVRGKSVSDMYTEPLEVDIRYYLFLLKKTVKS